MKKYLKNIISIVFLVLFLPYTITLLVSGKQGIHQEQVLPELEYQVLYHMMQEDYSWMSDGTLDLMAILYRTECVRLGEESEVKEISPELYEKNYARMYDAVLRTEGKVIKIDGAYKELPYHAVSAGSTRDGHLLGDEFSYIKEVPCPLDLESNNYLQICVLTEEEIKNALGDTFDPLNMTIERDGADYVTHIVCPAGQWKGENVRKLLHLSSSCFYMENLDGQIRITVKGNGHGFGISLYTADQMIKEGAGIESVVQIFYQDAECITIS